MALFRFYKTYDYYGVEGFLKKYPQFDEPELRQVFKYLDAKKDLDVVEVIPEEVLGDHIQFKLIYFWSTFRVSVYRGKDGKFVVDDTVYKRIDEANFIESRRQYVKSQISELERQMNEYRDELEELEELEEEELS